MSTRSGKMSWTAAIVLTAMAVMLLLGSLALLVMVLVVQPHVPYLVVPSATLNVIRYDQLAIRDLGVALVLEAHNDNARAPATFSRLQCRLKFAGATVAVLGTEAPLSVPAKGVVTLPYVARARDVALGDAGREIMLAAESDGGVLPFELEGQALTRWQLEGVAAIHQWTRLSCHFGFFLANRSAMAFRCSGKEFKFF